MGQIKLKIDVQNGTIDVEADDSNFAAVMDQAGTLLDKFAAIDTTPKAAVKPNKPAREPAADNSGEQVEGDASGDASQGKKRRRAGSGGKTASWKMVDGLLDEAQRVTLRKFFADKAPLNQNEKVAVLAVKLKELLKKDAFSGDEMHTAFQTVDEKTPKNLMAVFGNMTAAGWSSVADKKLKTNFKADDHVKHNLPRKAKGGK